MRRAATELVGVCAPWIRANPAALNSLFPFVVDGLGLSGGAGMGSVCAVAPAAAVALRDVCTTCAAAMPESVLSVYDTAMAGGRANVLSEKDRHAVIQGMGAVVSRLPPDRAAAGLLRLLQPVQLSLQLLHLQRLIHRSAPGPAAQAQHYH